MPALIDELQDDAAASLITQAVADGKGSSDLSRNITEAIRMLRNDWADRRLSALKLRIGQPGLLESDAVAIINEQGEMRRLKLQPMG